MKSVRNIPDNHIVRRIKMKVAPLQELTQVRLSLIIRWLEHCKNNAEGRRIRRNRKKEKNRKFEQGKDAKEGEERGDGRLLNILSML